MCVELQALCTPTPFEFPRHRASGVAIDRVFMLLAVLSRYAASLPMPKRPGLSRYVALCDLTGMPS